MRCVETWQILLVVPVESSTTGGAPEPSYFFASAGFSLPLVGVLPAGVIAPCSWPFADVPAAGAGTICGGAAATTGTGFGTGLPALFMLAWKFFTVLSSAAAWSAFAFSAAAASFAFFSSAAALALSSSGGGGGIFDSAAPAKQAVSANAASWMRVMFSLPSPAAWRASRNVRGACLP